MNINKNPVQVAKGGVVAGTRGRINVIDTGSVLWTITDDVAGDEIEIEADVDEDFITGLIVPERPTFSANHDEDMEVTSLTAGSQAYTSDSMHITRHTERYSGRVFDAILSNTTGVAGTSQYRLAIYDEDPTTHNPVNLLWYGPAQDASAATGTTGVKVFTFAGGTWEVAGASYKDGSSRLVLERGQSIWKVLHTVGTASVRSVTLGACRPLGRDLANGTAFTMFSGARAFALGLPATVPALTGQTLQVPMMPLRYL